jgi:flagellar hook protein FlgE
MTGLISAVQGLERSEAQFNKAAETMAQSPASGVAGPDSVDLSAAAVALIEARNSFEANTKVVQVLQDVERSLLNIVG